MLIVLVRERGEKTRQQWISLTNLKERLAGTTTSVDKPCFIRGAVRHRYSPCIGAGEPPPAIELPVVSCATGSFFQHNAVASRRIQPALCGLVLERRERVGRLNWRKA